MTPIDLAIKYFYSMTKEELDKVIEYANYSKELIDVREREEEETEPLFI